MGRCWSCGSHVSGGVNYVFTCPHCAQVQEIKNLREEASANLSKLAEIQQRGFEELSDRLEEVSSIIEWGFEEIKWELRQQTDILKGISRSLQTPKQTQAEELRFMAEQLRVRDVLEESEKRFLAAIELNPLDYRIYIGIAFTYLKMGELNKARLFLEKSLPHAPKSRIPRVTDPDYDLAIAKQQLESIQIELDLEDEFVKAFLNLSGDKGVAGKARDSMVTEQNALRRKLYYDLDYKSYSLRLIARTYMCEEAYSLAADHTKKALDLSPDFTDAIYDYSQYCALLKDKDICLSALKRAISDKPVFFQLARKESNFNPIRSDVNSQLDLIIKKAYVDAKSVLSNSETKLSNFEKTFLHTKDAAKKIDNTINKLCSWVKSDLSMYDSLLDSTKKRLGSAIRANGLSGLGDYKRLILINKEWKTLGEILGKNSTYLSKLYQLFTEMKGSWFRSPKMPTWWKEEYSELRPGLLEEWEKWLSFWENPPKEESTSDNPSDAYIKNTEASKLNKHDDDDED